MDKELLKFYKNKKVFVTGAMVLKARGCVYG